MGDFNTILTSENRINGNPVQEIEIRDFKNFLMDAGLDELKTVGRQYIWSNIHVHSRIGGILANAEWIQQWSHMEGIVMNPGFSDHCPLSLGFDITNQAGMRPFKFLICFASLSEFDATVKQIWRSSKRGSAMLSMWNKLKTLKGALKELNKQEFSGIESKIQATKGRLKCIKDQMNIPGQDAERVALEKATKLELEKWLMVEENVLK
uniref:Uncharacterized protein n=2 Tax=Nicotiana TaxID=4085 RepID=A0A1S4CQX5_TOBAC|nr:PREDICTED: uncharacterized protein LOC107821553 [Nicotiana tabacum]